MTICWIYPPPRMAVTTRMTITLLCRESRTKPSLVTTVTSWGPGGGGVDPTEDPACQRSMSRTKQHFVIFVITKNFVRYLKWRVSWTLFLAILGLGFPYIGRIHAAHIGEYLHFRYLKRLVMWHTYKICLKTMTILADCFLWVGPPFWATKMLESKWIISTKYV